MRWIRIVLGLTTIALVAAAAFSFNHAATVAPVDGTDPASDPQYASVATLNTLEWATYPDRSLIERFDAAKKQYAQQISDAEDALRRANASGASFAVLAGLALLAFGATFLPWRRWASTGRRTSGSAIQPVIERIREQLAPDGAAIIGRDKLKTYSVADELLKWTELHDKGVVTNEEFEESRRKILNRDA